MATISEKLLNLNTAKQDIKEAIKKKGADLTNIPFTQYGEVINSLDTKENLDDVLNEQDVAVTELEDVTDGMPTESPTCTDVTDTTATAGDVMTGKIFYDAEGNRTEGTGTLEQTLQGVHMIPLPEEYNDAGKNGHTKVIRNGFGDEIIYYTGNSKKIYYLDRKNKRFNEFDPKAVYSPSFYIFEDGDMLLYAGNNTQIGCKLFRHKTKEVIPVQASFGGRGVSSRTLNGKYVLFNHYLDLFDKETTTVTHLRTDMTGNENVLGHIHNDLGLFYLTPSNAYRYNEETGVFDKITSDTYKKKRFVNIEGVGIFITGDGFDNVYKYNEETKLFDKIATDIKDDYFNRYFVTSDNNLYLSSNNGSYRGIFKLNKNLNVFDKICDFGYMFTFYETINGNLFCYHSASGADYYAQLLHIDTSTNEIISVFSDVTSYSSYYFSEYEDKLYFSASSSSRFLGAYVIDYDTLTSRQIISETASSSYGSLYFLNVENNKYLSFSTSSSGLFRLNTDTQMYDKVYSEGCGFNGFYKFSDSEIMLYSTKHDSRIVKHKVETDTYVKYDFGPWNSGMSGKVGAIFEVSDGIIINYKNSELYKFIPGYDYRDSIVYGVSSTYLERIGNLLHIKYSSYRNEVVVDLETEKVYFIDKTIAGVGRNGFVSSTLNGNTVIYKDGKIKEIYDTIYTQLSNSNEPMNTPTITNYYKDIDAKYLYIYVEEEVTNGE